MLFEGQIPKKIRTFALFDTIVHSVRKMRMHSMMQKIPTDAKFDPSWESKGPDPPNATLPPRKPY